MSIGFIGVGQMGGGLARNLIRAGREVLVYDLNPQAVEKNPCRRADRAGCRKRRRSGRLRCRFHQPSASPTRQRPDARIGRSCMPK